MNEILDDAKTASEVGKFCYGESTSGTGLNKSLVDSRRREVFRVFLSFP